MKGSRSPPRTHRWSEDKEPQLRVSHTEDPQSQPPGSNTRAEARGSQGNVSHVHCISAEPRFTGDHIFSPSPRRPGFPSYKDLQQPSRTKRGIPQSWGETERAPLSSPCPSNQGSQPCHAHLPRWTSHCLLGRPLAPLPPLTRREPQWDQVFSVIPQGDGSCLSTGFFLFLILTPEITHRKSKPFLTCRLNPHMQLFLHRPSEALIGKANGNASKRHTMKAQTSSQTAARV